MGIENQDFTAAAETLRDLHDGKTDGSPIFAAASQIEDEQPTVEEPAASPKQNPFEAMLDSIIIAQIDAQIRAVAEAEAAEAVQEATEAYGVARKLDVMSMSVSASADDLELNGLDEVAGYLRGAMKLLRKASRAARDVAQGELEVAQIALDTDA